MLNQTEIKRLSYLSHSDWMKVRKKYVEEKIFDKKKATMNLRDIKKIFDGYKFNFWLIGGTLLGAVREKDFISWDDDIDIAVYEEEFLPKYDVLKKKFIAKGFIFRDTRKSMGTKITLWREGPKNSIDCLFLKPDYEKNEYRLSRVRRHPRKYFEKYGTIEFKGMIFRVPSPPNKYLASMYEHWEKPIKSSQPEVKWRNKNIYWRKGIHKKEDWR